MTKLLAVSILISAVSIGGPVFADGGDPGESWVGHDADTVRKLWGEPREIRERRDGTAIPVAPALARTD